MDTQRSLVSLQDLKPVIRWWNVSNLWPEVGCSMSDRVSCRPRAQTEIRADQTRQQAGGRARAQTRAGSGRVGPAAFVCKQTGWKPLQGGRNAVRWKVKNKKTPSWQQETWWCHQEHDVVLFWSRTSTLCWISLLTYCYFTSIKLFYCL